MIGFLWRIHPGLSIAAMAIGISAAIAGGTYVYRSIYSKGYDQAIADVAAKNKGALANVRKATKTVSDCYAANGEWDAVVGVCK